MSVECISLDPPAGTRCLRLDITTTAATLKKTDPALAGKNLTPWTMFRF